MSRFSMEYDRTINKEVNMNPTDPNQVKIGVDYFSSQLSELVAMIEVFQSYLSVLSRDILSDACKKCDEEECSPEARNDPHNFEKRELFRITRAIKKYQGMMSTLMAMLSDTDPDDLCYKYMLGILESFTDTCNDSGIQQQCHDEVKLGTIAEMLTKESSESELQKVRVFCIEL